MLPKHIKISLASKMSYFMDILEFISYSIADYNNCYDPRF